MRAKLVIAFSLVVLVSIVAFAFLMSQGTAREIRAYMFRGGMTDEPGLIEALQVYYAEKGSWEGLESYFDGLTGMHGRMGGVGPGGGFMSGMMGQQIQVADAEGVIVYDTSGFAGGTINILERLRAINLELQGETIGYLLIGSGTGALAGDETLLLERLNRAALFSALIGGGLALALSLLFAYRLLQPIQGLTRAAQQLAQGDLNQRVQVNGNDELARLGNTFNQMAESLQKADQSRQALTADIAHELRTPLAVQKAYLEALQDGIYELNIENLQPVLDQNQLLNRLVDDLRTVAMADAGQLRLELAPADLGNLVQRVVSRFLPQAENKQIQLSYQQEENLPPAHLDAGRVEQILGNLLSNALRHTPEGGEIQVVLYHEKHSARLEIRDTGPGIPEDALEYIFDRFYRASKSRSRSEGGSGLGLTIARQLARAHGGEVHAANHPTGGAVFTLRLPLDQRS
jgi:two-component system OmpR family sensor kinase/two-component system sensor histidine kinase BaeS